jgi:electron transport complex protein RnfC
VAEVSDEQLRIVPDTAAADYAGRNPPKPPNRDELPSFCADMGLAGMGGSMFPAAIKLAAAEGIDTLVINAVECEPGIQIDEALLCSEFPTVKRGAKCLVEALGAKQTVLATKSSSVHRIRAALPRIEYEILVQPDTYPAGAEKLIVARLAGRMPPTGVLPVHMGFLVFSVASLWAIGRYLEVGAPSIERPLTVVPAEGETRNAIIPLGTHVGELLQQLGIEPGKYSSLFIAGGMMMGRQVTAESPVLKGTNAVIVRTPGSRLLREREPCVQCGACFDACPLGLHPIGMERRIREKRLTPALATQLEECFLCGACAAVCPADIPLAEAFREGKSWLRENRK